MPDYQVHVLQQHVCVFDHQVHICNSQLCVATLCVHVCVCVFECVCVCGWAGGWVATRYACNNQVYVFDYQMCVYIYINGSQEQVSL